jgi:hypothetical protein
MKAKACIVRLLLKVPGIKSIKLSIFRGYWKAVPKKDNSSCDWYSFRYFLAIKVIKQKKYINMIKSLRFSDNLSSKASKCFSIKSIDNNIKIKRINIRCTERLLLVNFADP